MIGMPHPGDLARFQDAYRAQAAYVAHVLGRLSVPDEAVGDAVQDVFVAAYRRWDDFDPRRPVRPWLTGFARRIAFRYRRSAARRQRKGAAWLHVVRDRERPISHEVEARDFLQRFLAQVDAGHRRAFLMLELEGLSAPEAATALGITTEAVYGRVRTTRRRLKQALLVDARRPDPKAAALVPPWAVLRDKLGIGVPTIALPTTAPIASGLKTFAATVAIGLVGLTVLHVATDRHEPARTTPSVTERAPKTAADAVVVAAAAAPTHADTEVTTAAPTPLRGQATTAPSPEAAPRRAPTTGPEDQTPAAIETPRSELAQENALLRSAKSALARGDAATALAHLDAHARRFPTGQLEDARRRSRIRALCDLGRVAQAQGEAQLLVRTHPDDPLASQSLTICTASAIQNPHEVEK